MGKLSSCQIKTNIILKEKLQFLIILITGIIEWNKLFKNAIIKANENNKKLMLFYTVTNSDHFKVINSLTFDLLPWKILVSENDARFGILIKIIV